MTWEDIKRKLTSRKFWAAIVEFVTMLLLANGMTENQVGQITAIIMAGAGVLAYIIAEGLTDKESVAKIEPKKPPEEASAADPAEAAEG